MPLAGIPPTSRPISQETMCKWEKSIKESTVICNQDASLYRCVNKVQNEMQDNLRLLFGEIGKGKSPHKGEKVFNELKDLTSFQQNVNFVLGKSMQHMADTLFVQAAKMTLLRYDSYLEYLKLGEELDTLWSLRNSPLHHSALFSDVVITKIDEVITKSETVGLSHLYERQDNHPDIKSDKPA